MVSQHVENTMVSDKLEYDGLTSLMNLCTDCSSPGRHDDLKVLAERIPAHKINPQFFLDYAKNREHFVRVELSMLVILIGRIPENRLSPKIMIKKYKEENNDLVKKVKGYLLIKGLLYGLSGKDKKGREDYLNTYSDDRNMIDSLLHDKSRPHFSDEDAWLSVKAEADKFIQDFFSKPEVQIRFTF